MTIAGTVIKGKSRGKELGFPTANMKLTDKIENGIYISKTLLDGMEYPSVTFIGNALTFGDKEIFAETYLINFNKEIYNKNIKVKLIKKIRENEKFQDKESLIVQIRKDVDVAKKYFKI